MILSEQQCHSFPSISLCFVRFGLWVLRRGVGYGIGFIWNIFMGVVRCGPFGWLVLIVLLFVWVWVTFGVWVCCKGVFLGLDDGENTPFYQAI